MNEPQDETEKQCVDRIFDTVRGLTAHDDPELVLIALTSVIAQIVRDSDPASQTKTIVYVLHTFAHAFEKGFSP